MKKFLLGFITITFLGACSVQTDQETAEKVSAFETPLVQTVSGLDVMINDVLNHNPFVPALDEEKQRRVFDVAIKAVLAELGMIIRTIFLR